MKISSSKEGFVLEVSETELITINNCINDAADVLKGEEFSIRVGVERQEALFLVHQISQFFREIGR